MAVCGQFLVDADTIIRVGQLDKPTSIEIVDRSEKKEQNEECHAEYAYEKSVRVLFVGER